MKIVYKQYRNIAAGMLLLTILGIRATYAQNVPTLSITQPAGNVTGVDLPPATAPGVPASVKTYAPKVAMQTEPNSFTSADQVSTATVFKDGFNRPMQTVQHYTAYSGGTPVNLVQPIDTRFQSDPLSFLAYPSASPNYNPNMFTAQRDYYYGKYPGENYTAAGRTVSLSNFNQRASKTMLPGKSQIGQSRGVTTKRITNGPNDLRMWITLPTGEPSGSVNYPEGTLFGEQVIDSTGAEVITYTNKDGQIVCRRVLAERNPNPVYMYTYYAYDDAGRLRWILPHKAVVVSLGTLSQEVKDNLCYQYMYDDKGRMVERKMPGKAVEDFIYDKRDRLVYYRDGILRAKNQWRFTLYDPLDRPTVTAVATSPISRIDLVNLVNDNSTYSPPHILYYVKNYEVWNGYPQTLTGALIHSYTYYDNYTLADPVGDHWLDYYSKIQWNNEWQTIPGAEEPIRANRDGSRVTGSKVRIQPAPGADVNQTGEWRQSAFYYDDKGRQIYSYSEDIDGNGAAIHKQYNGVIYDFTGRPLLSKHVSSNAKSTDGYTDRTELYRNEYDPVTGLLTQTKRKGGASPWSISSMYAYDELGRVKRKVLGNYGEVQDMDYNIRGQLLGINGVYAETGNKEGESRTFGQLLRYDYGFTQPKLDGKIAGMAWRGSSAANNVAMAYGYGYDLAGRLKQADFRLRDAGVWGNNLMDYSVSNLTYDGNGNIKTMTQKATRTGVGIFTMDNLSYTYEGTNESSNRLQRVADAVTNTGTYGLDDFQDGNTSTTDYTYDNNGNLTKDLNKGISSITYTDLNKPQLITFANGNTIAYSYDIAGNKVQERTQNGSTVKVTDYISNYVYEDNKLKMVITPEGRSIPSSAGTEEREEYFVKDYLGNVRSVIDVYTYPIKQYLATYEIASAGLEGLFFDYHNEIRDDNPSSPAPSDLKSGRLNGLEADRRVGTALLLKVMAGDKVEMDVNTFFEGYDMDQENPVSANTMMNSIVSTLATGTGGWPDPGDYHNPLLAQDLFNTSNYINIYQGIKNGVTDNTRPRAYLNYILFDEDMRIVGEMSGAYQATGNGTWATVGTSSPMTIPANGFLSVYLSNESQNIACANCSDVYFDQLSVRITEGKLKEEAHYYPHGLPIAGMGSAANGFVDNKKRHQGNDFNRELGLNWMDFHNRQYDPQLGRFLSVDPLAESTPMMSPYTAMNNDPVSNVDPLGLQSSSKTSPNITEHSNPMAEHLSRFSPGTLQAWGLMVPSSWGQGGSGFMITFYGDEAGAVWASISGQKWKAEGSTEGTANAWDDMSIVSESEVDNSASLLASLNDEEPVKFLANDGSYPILNDAFDNISYKTGDNVFYVMGHGNRDLIEDASGTETVRIRNAEIFDKQMSAKSPAYKTAIDEGKSFVLWLYVCTSTNMAQKISAAHPKATIIGANGVIHFSYKNGNPAIIGIATSKLDVNRTGTFIAYQNGVEVYRLPYVKTIIFPRKK